MPKDIFIPFLCDKGKICEKWFELRLSIDRETEREENKYKINYKRFAQIIFMYIFYVLVQAY